MASDNYMFRRTMVDIIRLCSYRGKLNTIGSSIWFGVEISNTLTLSIMQYCYQVGVCQEFCAYLVGLASSWNIKP